MRPGRVPGEEADVMLLDLVGILRPLDSASLDLHQYPSHSCLTYWLLLGQYHRKDDVDALFTCQCLADEGHAPDQHCRNIVGQDRVVLDSVFRSGFFWFFSYFWQF